MKITTVREFDQFVYFIEKYYREKLAGMHSITSYLPSEILYCHNVYSLAESKFEPSFVPMGIYFDTRMIGFLMYGKDPEDGTYWIIRFMIDQAEQGKGYGKFALAQTINFIKALPDCSPTIILGVKESNTAAMGLYQSFGFKDTGRREHGELLLEYVIQ